MSSFFRQLGRQLQTSSSARYILYGTAAVGTGALTWRMQAKSRNEQQLQRRNAHHHDTVSHVKEVKITITESASPSTDITDGAVEVIDEGSGEEAANTGAFDPVTGEINWDCPCLGGMAHGPCGPQFRLAFACFVHSEADPKGMDCVEKFQGMQECFREHPEIYAEELADDGEDDDVTEGPTASTTPPPEVPPASGGAGLEIPPPAKEPRRPKPSDEEDVLPGGVTPPPTPQPKPPITPPPLPPADPKPPSVIDDPPANPLPPTIIDPPTGPVAGTGITNVNRRNPPRQRPTSHDE